jgi:hypothetical protein
MNSPFIVASSQLVLQALSNTNSNMFKIVGVVRPNTPNGVCNHSAVSWHCI